MTPKSRVYVVMDLGNLLLALKPGNAVILAKILQATTQMVP